MVNEKKRRFGRVRRWVFRVAAAIVSLEVALQLLALLAPSLWDRVERPEAGTRRVLCVGDSFTFGIGASPEKSYPAHLQRMLRERFPAQRWAVINAGRPGTNSAQAAGRLATMLDRYHPELVLALTGINNRWNTSRRPASAKSSRSARADSWLASHVRLYKLARWVLGGVLRSSVPPPPAETSTATELLKVTAPSGIGSRVWQGEIHSRRARAESLRRSGDRPGALRAFKNIVLRYPRDYVSWGELGWLRLNAGKREEAQRAFARSLRIRDDWAPALWGQSEIALESGNLDSFLDLATRAAVIDGDMGRFVERCSSIRGDDDERFQRALQRLRIVARERHGEGWLPQRLEPVLELFQNREKRREVLQRDFGDMRRVCRAHGARLVVLTYPEPLEADVIIGAADAADADLFPVHPLFQRLLRDGGKRSAYFVPDGHLNGIGYKVMARAVLEHLISDGLLNQTSRR